MKLSDFRFSDDCSDDLRLCIVANDADFGGEVVAVEIPLDVPSDRENGGMTLVNRIVAALNAPADAETASGDRRANMAGYLRT
jgi:hypothetical protein